VPARSEDGPAPDLTPPPQEVAAALQGEEAMEAAMLDYFAAEKGESLIFLLAGVLATIVSVLLWRSASEYRAMAYPLIAIGLIQIAVGGAIYARTDRQVDGLRAELARDAAAYRAAELPRMAKVSAGFKLYKAIELALLAAGIALTFAFKSRPALYAVGIGLILQSSVMLVLDLFAERRADRYVAALEQK
jgi:hypothetical protein